MPQKTLFRALTVFIIFSLLLSACAGPKSKAPAAPPRGVTGAITTGKEVTATSATVNPSGGNVTVTDPASPIAGLEITVPPNSYSAATPFKISYAPIEKQTFGDVFNPVTPMIIVDNGGGFSDESITVKVPAKIPPDHFAMGFLYDDKTKKLEGLPLVEQDKNSITVATNHFSNIIIAVIELAKLDLAIDNEDIDSSFRPGVDDWQFGNYGSYINPNGYCAGATLTSMWYYVTRPDGKTVSLNGRYDNNGNQPATPKFDLDDSTGWRFASVAHQDQDLNNELRTTTRGLSKASPETAFRLFAYSIMLTGEPQIAEIWQTNPNPRLWSGHSVVVYRVFKGELYIADPNHRGNTNRRVDYDKQTRKFKPYWSGNTTDPNAEDDIAYDMFIYTAKTALVDYNKMAELWIKFKNGTIGNGIFPSYEISRVDDQGDLHELDDGYISPVKMLKLQVDSPDVDGGFYLYRDVNDKASKLIATFYEEVEFELKPGNNLLGFQIMGLTAGNSTELIDFKYINVVYKEPAAKTWTLVETRILPTGGISKNSSFMGFKGFGDEVTVKDGTATRKMYDSDKQSWSVTMTYDFDKPPAILKTGDVLTLNSSVTGSYSGKPTFKDDQTFEDFSYQAGHWADDSSSIDNVWRQPVQAVGIRMGEMVSGGPVTKSNVTKLIVPESHSGDIGIMASSGLSFNVWWIYRAK